MMPTRPALTPLRTKLVWLAAAMPAAVGLAFRYGQLDRIPGLTEPILPASVVRILLIAAAGVFVLGQLLMTFPPELLGERFRKWWPNLLAVVAGLIWWGYDRPGEALILDAAGAYILAVGAWGIARAGLHALTQGGGYERCRPAGWRLLVAGLVLAAVGGAVLSLPACWSGTYPVNWDSTYPGQARGELWMHWLDCSFTAAAALTGTALVVQDIGLEFNSAGHVVLMVLMQIGGLAVLAIGTAAALRLRRMIGWGAPDDDISPRGVRRLIASVFLIFLLAEAAGAFFLQPMWDGSADANFADGGDRRISGAFHAISALCNAGLALPRDSMVNYRDCWLMYAVILPLMIMGSIGGPVLVELLRRLVRRGGLGLRSLSPHSGFTLLGTAVMLAGVAVLLVAIESTPNLQLRNPRNDTPGRLLLPNAASQPAGFPTTTAQAQERVRSQRLATMEWPERWKAAVFLSAASRTTGMRTVRMDESSLSPAGRFVLMAAMLVGGDVGGTAGGLRLTVVLLLLAAIRFRWTSDSSAGNISPGARHQALAVAAGLVACMALLIGATTLVLAYRETGSPIACMFEAISACCNVGFSTGLTDQLSVQGRVAVILAMLLGRVVPLAFLLRCLRVPPVPMPPEPVANG
ncbi:MAG TPA: potassium transporter TrkG [Phycisphaerae bacterium]|nr:potassium transporter TrkG [Phycisphaerae bacterium]